MFEETETHHVHGLKFPIPDGAEVDIGDQLALSNFPRIATVIEIRETQDGHFVHVDLDVTSLSITFKLKKHKRQ